MRRRSSEFPHRVTRRDYMAESRKTTPLGGGFPLTIGCTHFTLLRPLATIPPIIQPQRIAIWTCNRLQTPFWGCNCSLNGKKNKSSKNDNWKSKFKRLCLFDNPFHAVSLIQPSETLIYSDGVNRRTVPLFSVAQTTGCGSLILREQHKLRTFDVRF